MQAIDLRKVLLTFLILMSPGLTLAQDADQWFTLGNDFAHTRYTTVDELSPENFGDLEVAWEWDGASFWGGKRPFHAVFDRRSALYRGRLQPSCHRHRSEDR